MKLTHITIRDFLGIRNADIDCSAPVTLICGPNYVGKTSIAQAVALALTGALPRVSLKRDAGILVNDAGAKSSSISVRTSDGDEYAATITASGAVKHNVREFDPMLPYVLDAQRFASLPPAERRAFLFGLMDIQTSREVVSQRLIARGCDATKVAQVVPMLRAGFDAAHAEAKAKTTEARAAWKAVTGEVYGHVKADGWRADVAAFAPEVLAQAEAALAGLTERHNAAQQLLGEIRAQLRGRDQKFLQAATLRPVAEQLTRRKSKLAHDEDALAAAQRSHDEAQALAGAAPRSGLIHDLASGLRWALALAAGPEFDDDPNKADAGAALEAYDREHGPAGSAGSQEARDRLPVLAHQLGLMQRAVAASMRDARASEDAASQVSLIEKDLAAPFDADAFATAERQTSDIAVEQSAQQRAVESLRAAKSAAERADSRTKQAAGHHAAAVAWDAIAAALSPDGIQAEMMAEALGPINARLAQSAIDTEWRCIEIAPDMTIHNASGRPYALLSASERWRADAMIAEAVSHISGAGLLVLDGFDILDLPGRSGLIGWIEALSEAGEISTCLLLGTLKAAPAGLPPAFSVAWIDGIAIDRREAEAV